MARRPISTRLSAFRFSLSSLRSPLSPQKPKLSNVDESASDASSPVARRVPDLDEKGSTGIAVTVVDSDNINALRTPRALPTPSHSPITPWTASFHRNAATTSQETFYLKQTALLRFARLSLASLIFATSVTLIALTSDVLAHYNRTHLSSILPLSLWPTDLNLTPTLLALATAVITALLALPTIIIAFLPSPNPRTKLNNTLFTTLCAISTPLTLATLILSSAVSPSAIFSSFVSSTLTSLVTTTGPSGTIGLTPNGHGSNPKRETIQSFTCTVANSARAFNRDASVLQLPSLASANDLVPSGFHRICVESKAGLAVLIVLLGLAVVGCAVAGWSWAVESRIERLRGEKEVLASRHGSRDGKDVPESLIGEQRV